MNTAQSPTQSPTDLDPSDASDPGDPRLDAGPHAPADPPAEPAPPRQARRDDADDDDHDPLDRLRRRLGLRDSPAADDSADDSADGSVDDSVDGSVDRSADDSHAPAARRATPDAEGRLVPLAPPRPRTADDFDDDDVQEETERFAPESAEDLSLDAGKAKICLACGKDLRGHRRYRSPKGYLCASCEKEDRIRRIACAECGKPTLPENLRPWGPISICARCFIDHENDPKSRVRKKISNKGFESAERQNLLIVAGVAVVLLLVIALSWLGVIGG